MLKKLSVLICLLISPSSLQATELFNDAFETWTSSVGNWTATRAGSGNVVITTNTLARDGTKCLASIDSSASYSESNIYKDNLTLGSTNYMRYYLYLPETTFWSQLGNSAYVRIGKIYSSLGVSAGTAVYLQAGKTSSGARVVRLYQTSGGGSTSSSCTVSADSWFCFEVMVPTPTISSDIRWWINGTEQVKLNANISSMGYWRGIDIGIWDNNPSLTPLYTIYFDELIVADTYIGPLPIDVTPPTNIATVNDGLGTDASFTYSTTTLSANWTASSDPQTNISKYYYAIGTTQGGTQTADWTIVTTTYVTKTGLTLTMGTTYYFSVKAENGAGLQTANTTYSDGQFIKLDATAPGTVTTVRDGLVADVSSTTSSTQLYANWDEAADAESGISTYFYAIGTTLGASDIVGWTDNEGTNLYTYESSLSLTVGTTYYFAVKAVNGSGVAGGAINSNGQFACGDVTPPSQITTVNDGISGIDLDTTNSTTTLSANWMASADAESGISKYQYAIGTTQGGTQTLVWTDNSISTSTNVTKTNLLLTRGTTYYFTVRAVNGSQLAGTPQNSDGILVSPIVTVSTPSLGAPWPSPPQIIIFKLDDWELHDSGSINGAQACIDMHNEFANYGSTVNWVMYCLAESDKYTQSVRNQASAAGVGLGWSGYTEAGSTMRKLLFTQGSEVGGHTEPIANSVAYNTDVQEQMIQILKDEFADVGLENIYAIHAHSSFADDSFFQANAATGMEYNPTFVSNMDNKQFFWPCKMQNEWPFTGYRNDGYPFDAAATDYSNLWAVFRQMPLRADNGETRYWSSMYHTNAEDTDFLPVSGPYGSYQRTPADAKRFVYDSFMMTFNYLYGSNRAPFVFSLHPFQMDPEGRAHSSDFWNPYLKDSIHDFLYTVLVSSKAQYPNTYVWTYHQALEYVRTGDVDHVIAMGNGQGSDTTPPTAPDQVNDGTGADVDSTYSTSQLSANWTAGSDPESGIGKYWYAIGTSAGATNVVAWTGNGTNTSVTKTNLTLTVGTTYYFTVKSENGQGTESLTVTNSNGQYVKIDYTPPDWSIGAEVRDGTGVTDLLFTYSTTTLSANWDTSTDPESGVAHYRYAIGTSPGTTDITGWTDNVILTSVTKSGLTLSVGSTYYFSVIAENASGVQGNILTSDGQYVNFDNNPPTTPAAIRDGLSTTSDDDTTLWLTVLSANWDASTAASGIVRYYYAVGTAPSTADVVDWTATANGAVLSVTKQLTLTKGTTYYFSVKAENGSGLQSGIATTDGILVTGDVTPPLTIAHVYDGLGDDISTSDSLTELSANWDSTSDPETSVIKYWYAIGTSAGASDVLGWTNNDLNTSVTHTGLALTTGRTYYFSVVAENGAGSKSIAANSDGQTATGLGGETVVGFDATKIGPNPFVVSRIGGGGVAGSTMKFTKIPSGSKLIIYTISGKLVSDLTETSNNTISWNGKNTSGDVIAQGVYIYCLKDSNGNKKTGKIAVKTE
ncbi:MAG: hypothetical protein A3J83_04780 [Elusimicrobia bacterium RIFOXYA2_FULL_40_6]|nr:MAG: hypothetical protein A3J83_04780 [Elusimicrobia bacterium RIFOXYA2_FULL_40_6]